MKNRVFKLAGGLALAGVLFVSNFSTATASSDVANTGIKVQAIGIENPTELAAWTLLGPNWLYKGDDKVKVIKDIAINPEVRF